MKHYRLSLGLFVAATVLVACQHKPPSSAGSPEELPRNSTQVIGHQRAQSDLQRMALRPEPLGVVNGRRPFERKATRFPKFPKNEYKLSSESGTLQSIVTTLAGGLNTCDPMSYDPCYSPQGFHDGVGDSARFYGPWGLAIDENSHIYVADLLNNAIRKVTPAGEVTTLAGGGPDNAGYVDGSSTSAKFDQPSGVAVDAHGNVYVADTYNNRIRKITPEGTVSTYAGSGPTGWGYSGFADGPALTAKFYLPTGLVIDKHGNVLVADAGNNRIRKISPNGLVTTVAGGTTELNEYGNPSGGFADGPAATAQFKAPYDLAIDAQENIYVADYSNLRVRKITPTGIVSTLAGSGDYGIADGPGDTAQFTFIGGVTVDTCGNVYTTDENNLRIRKIAPSGEVTSIAGTGTYGFADGPAFSAQFEYPEGIVASKDGHLYISEYYGGRIRKMNIACNPSGGSIGGSDSNAFSPNEDGVKDTYDVDVIAEGAWTLEVDDHPGSLSTGPGPNTGNKTFAWDGKVNGILLPDGKYTLRLNNGPEDKTVEIIIDTIYPEIKSGNLIRINSDIESSNPLKIKNSYTFNVEASDAGSGLDDKSIKYESENLNAAPETKKISDSVFEATAEVSSGQASELRYSLVVTDLAGNRTTSKEATVRGKLKPGKPLLTQGDSSSSASAYTLKANALQGNRAFQGVYYSKSGLDLSFSQTFTFRYFQSGKEVVGIPGTAHMIVRNTSNQGEVGYVGKLKFQTGIETPETTFGWDGLNFLSEPAKQGLYKLEPTEPEWVEGKKGFEFKVSDMPCIKQETWESEKAFIDPLLARIPIERLAHILDAHILNGPNKLTYPKFNITEPRTSADLFGSYDNRLQYPRPLHGKHKGAYPKAPYYTEWFEVNLAHKVTRALLQNIKSRDIVETIFAMGISVSEDSGNDPRKRYASRDGNATVMPVVFENDLVKWVGIVRHTDGIGVKTIFPAYDAGTGHEKNIH